MKLVCLATFLLVVISGTFSAFTQEEQNALAKHNYFRQIHGVPSLTLDRQTCGEAKEYAEQLAQSGTGLTHSSTEDGENLSMGCSISGQTMEEAVTNWYDEVCGYDFNSRPDGATVTGHFTQVVWKGSTNLGIGRAEKDIVYQGFNLKCGYIVARYKPAGNVRGEYTENVPEGDYNPSYCKTESTKRKKYFDENGKPVIIVTPLTEVDVPEVKNGTSAHASLRDHQHIAKPLHSKKKETSHGLKHQ